MSGVNPQLIIDGLVARGVPLPAAIGIAGNIAVESGFRTDINEAAPIVPGSRGGYGLIQWTGPRRRQFEAYAGDNLADLDTQLDFLVHELGTTEKKAASAIYAANDPIEAARLVSERFLRPGIPHMDRRIAETERLMGGAARSTAPAGTAVASATPGMIPLIPTNALQQQQEAPQQDPRMNRLAMMQQMMPRTNALNVADFQMQTPMNALQGFSAGVNPITGA